MARQKTIDKVPIAEVARVKKEFEDDGATVVVTPNADGTTSRVVASYPNPVTIDKVPNAEVARVKKEFEDDGATVVVTPNTDGTTSRVVATYP